jgi:LmbE family N-acetylglucosaminyl deacetylase
MTGLSADGSLLAISPHLDDAVMAVGATLTALAETGRSVLICTVFAGEPAPPFSPVADSFHADCGLDGQPVARRRAEDIRAAEEVGATAVHMPFLDAIYRRNGRGWLCDTPRGMFEAEPPAEPDLRHAITEEIRRLVAEIRPSAVWTCAAIGNHIDHRITRIAVTDAAASQGWAPVLWEGIPYAMGLDPPDGISPLRYADVHDEHLSRKISAIGQYSSQIRMLWPEGQNWRSQFLGHARRRRALGVPELLWYPSLRQAPAHNPATSGR